MKVLVGLGNPGSAYERTRHNLGFRVLDHLAKALGIGYANKRADNAYVASYDGWADPVLLVKPTTFMNLSGAAVARIVGRHHLAPQDVIVVADDLAIPLGTLRVRMRGGAGGHNGLNSVIESLESQDFPRLRVGIGTGDLLHGEMTDFVLGEFSAVQEKQVREIIPLATQALEMFVNEGVRKAMNVFNQKEGHTPDL